MYRYLICSVIIISFIFISCSDNVTEKEEVIVDYEYLGMQNSGCLKHGLEKTTSEETYLKDWDLVDGILDLSIYHLANCCTEFVDSVAVSGNTIDLFLQDVHQNCHCICDYTTDYSFRIPTLLEYHIRFNYKAYLATTYTCTLDTVIHVQ